MSSEAPRREVDELLDKRPAGQTADQAAQAAIESANTPNAAPPPLPAAPPPPTRLPDVWMVSDRPLRDHFEEQDRFNFKDYASALATVLDHEKTDTPFTMAINAPWGSGKTTLANMIAAELVQRPADRGHAAHRLLVQCMDARRCI